MARACCRAGLSVIAILMVLCASPAHADRPSREHARTLFRAAKVAYTAARYDEAARLFSEGYALDPAPAFLLNIAQSYRSAGKLKLALEHYHRYLEAAPKTQLRAQVEDLIRDLEGRAKVSRAPVGAVEPPAASLPSSRPAPPDTSARPFYRSWWFWTVVGAVAVTGAGLGAYYGTREPGYLKEGGLGAVRW